MYNITAFGATGSAKTNDAPYIQKAIDICSEAGGGIVYFPPGIYLSGTLVLKSNVTLYLEAGAKIVSSTCKEDFTIHKAPEHYRWKMDRCGLIYGKGIENVTIMGRGSINGLDKAFWTPKNSIGEGWNSTPARYWAKEWRPTTILLEDCRNVLIQDITIKNSPAYSCWFINCSIFKLQRHKRIE